MRIYSVFFILALFASALLVSCGKGEKKEDKQEATTTDPDDWTALDDFHMVMADVYHPLKDSGNVKPIMEKAGELAKAAEKLATAELPEKVNNDNVKAMIGDLQKDTRSLADAIAAGAKEEDVKAKLESLHTLFHKVQEAWYGGHGEHKGDHKEKH
jgi:hypothetical protein